MQTPQDNRSLGELFTDLARDMSNLVRQEVTLARTEITQKMTGASKNIAFLAIGGFVAYAGFLVLLAAITLALIQLGITWWLAALIVAVVVIGVGYFLLQIGLSGLKRTSLAPQQTIETLKEDATWAKEQTT
ncbi:MAG: phage holin family protein [Ktedonobacterales bacterium]